MPEPSAAEPWFEKARHDIRTAELLLSAGEYPADIVCFHSQQAAEKALKGALAFTGVIAPFTHDLVRLVALLPSGSAEVIADATSLSPYAVASRYPDANEKYDDALARLALAASLRICEFTERLTGTPWTERSSPPGLSSIESDETPSPKSAGRSDKS
jgi:HEPN domain-containing protein